MLLVPGHDCNHFILGGQAVGRIGDDQDAVCKFFEQAVERIRHAVSGGEWRRIRFEFLGLRVLLNFDILPIPCQTFNKVIPAYIFVIR